MFYPWVGKVFWRRKWLPTLVFLPGQFHGQKEPGGLQSVGSQRVKHDGAINKFSFSAYDLLSFAGRQTYIHIWALTGSNCVNLSKKHNTLSEPQNHHLYSGDDINNSPEDE